MSQLVAGAAPPRKHRGRRLLVPIAAGLAGLVIGSAGAADGDPVPTPAVTVTETTTAPPVTETATQTAAAPAPVTETVTESATVTATAAPTRSAAASAPEAEALLGGGEAASYASCDAVRAAGAAPIRRGDPGFESKFDRDSDGVGCE